MRRIATKFETSVYSFRFNHRHSKRTVVAVLLSVPFTMPTAFGGENTSSDGNFSPEFTTTQFAVTVTAANPGRHPALRERARISDLAIDCEGRHFYRIARFQADNVTKFDIATPSRVIYQYSTQDPSDTAASNPYQMVFVNANKAYLLRYGSAKAWIVNPAASTQAAFKLGELNLGAYADADGIPEMVAGVVVNGKLFIVMQRFESFSTLQTAYVAVFDTVTDREISTGKGMNNLKGIPLSIGNPSSIQYLQTNNRLYINGSGKLAFDSDPAEYTGGIETIDPDNYDTRLVLDDGDESNHPFGQILDIALVSPTQGYFIGSADFQMNTLFRFNPTSGAVVSDVNGPTAVAGLFDANLTNLAIDRNAKLWVGKGDLAAPGMAVIDTANDSIEEPLIGTGLNPIETCFSEI